MPTLPRFQNFDLHIGQKRTQGFPLTVQFSPAGEMADPIGVGLDVDEPALRRWLERLALGELPGPDLVALGRRLARFLLPPGPVRDLYQRSLGIVEAREERLRLRLRIVPPQLAALPWEYAYDDDIADFFVLNPRTALVRYHGQPVTPRTIASHAPVPILALVANPVSTRRLQTTTEVGNLSAALEPLLQAQQARLDILFSGPEADRRTLQNLSEETPGLRLLSGEASVDDLRAALRQGYRVVHYVGHGSFDPDAGGFLLLADGEGRKTLVTAQTLAREMRAGPAGIVVLNACESASEDSARAFMGLAPNLIRAGVPAVVAMQYVIPDSSAVEFSQALYRALADGWPLDAAVTEGRKAIGAALPEDGMDWGIPVLFMRAPDGIIWRTDDVEKRAQEDEMARETQRRQPQAGDHIEAHMGDVGAGAQVAVGKGIRQQRTQAAPAASGSDQVELERLLAQLKHELAGLDIAEQEKIIGRHQVEQLERELTKRDEKPDASTIKVAGEWLLAHLPALAGTLARLFANPIAVRRVEVAGDVAAEWVRTRFDNES